MSKAAINIAGAILLAITILVTAGFTAKIHVAGKEIGVVWLFAGMIFLVLQLAVFSLRRSLILFFIVFIFFWVDKNFLFQSDHAGGAIGLNLGLTDLTIIAFFMYICFEKMRAGAWKFSFTPEFIIPSLLFIGLSGLSLVNTNHITLSALEIIRMIKVLAVFIFAVNIIRDYKDLTFVAYCLIAMLFAESVLGMLQFAMKGAVGLQFFGEGQTIMAEQLMEGSEITRISGTLIHPHTFSAVIGFIVPFSFMFGLMHKDPLKRWIFMGAFILGGCALLATFTRTNIVSFSVSMIIVLVLSMKRRFWNVQKRNMIVVILCIAVVSALPLVPKFYDRMLHANPGSGGVRIDYNRTSLEMLKEHPLFGVGINTYTETLADMGNPLGLMDRMPEGQAVEHNLYVLIAAETGIVGFMAFALIMIMIIRKALECYRSSNILVSAIGISMLSSYAGFFARSLLDFSYRLDQVFIFFWFMTGFLYAAIRLKRGQLPHELKRTIDIPSVR